MSDFATLVYNATPVGPVSLNALSTAMAAVPLSLASIQQATGCVNVSDTTSTGSGNAIRTIVFGLTYSCFGQFNGNNPLPGNSNTRQWFVVTTSGATASIGELIYDNGTGTGTATVVTAVTGRTIVTANAAATAFTGGITLTSLHLYTWSGAAWVDGGASKVYRSAFQNNFPAEAGSQAMPFNNLYTHALGAALGSVIVQSPPVIS